MSDKKPGRGSDQFPLRFPEGMREKLKEEAGKSGRSMNAEIIHRLANSLNAPSFADVALGLGDEDLDHALMVAAERNGRSLTEEAIFRLRQSLMDYNSLIQQLESEAWRAMRQSENMMDFFIQLTPDERRLLEERKDISEKAREYKISSKDLRDFLKLHPIGNRGRVSLRVPKSDYSVIIGENNTRYSKSESEIKIRSLCAQYARENFSSHNIYKPVFSAFTAWVRKIGFGDYLEFSSKTGAMNDVKVWFDEEFKDKLDG